MNEIPGWFELADAALFSWILDAQPRGDLLEVGAFFGRSAVHMGYHLRDDETFTVCDTFEPSADYPGISVEAFEANYSAHHDRPSTLAVMESRHLPEVMRHHSVRFAHIDGSHEFYDVQADLRDAAGHLLQPEAVLAVDDYRSPHTPGVAAAVWQAVLQNRLHPIAVTESKFYGTNGDPAPYMALLTERIDADPGLWHLPVSVGSHQFLRVTT